MFNKAIYVKNVKEIRYGTTQVPFSRTEGEIKELLKKHGCQQMVTAMDGNYVRIGFVYQGKPYMIDVPCVYVGPKKELNERIGIRLVLYYLEILLDWSKVRAIDFDKFLLGARMVEIEGKVHTLQEVVDKLPIPALTTNVDAKELPGGQ